MKQRVYRHISFEFDDPAALELQAEPDASRDVAVNGLRKGIGVESVTCLLSHRHEGKRTISIFGFSYVGSTEVVTEGWVLARSTTLLLGWFRDWSGAAPELSRVELTQITLGQSEDQEVERKDVTIEARVVEKRLTAFLGLTPDDFRI